MRVIANTTHGFCGHQKVKDEEYEITRQSDADAFIKLGLVRPAGNEPTRASKKAEKKARKYETRHMVAETEPQEIPDYPLPSGDE